ncbi:hypothetical protein KGA65_15485 [Ideonella sp. B7]|uniref:hypothetical protein n=1 Tax=Ideonella benzenivorans TaxID=2831643 RepID=UPI001CEC6AF0|nr:hypothetical protein [Ideonella benzenivorans]MCA6217935.1 hypothetical protein [Ideonella benzenivorans]
MSIEKSSSCASGEYLVLGEMLRRGYECYLANGPTQNGWDIVILNEHGANIRIQVKTIDWPEKNAINGKLDDGFDILIAVLLQRKKPQAKYVIASLNEIKPHLSAVSTDESTARGQRGGKERTLNLGKNFETQDGKKDLKVDEAGWSHLKALIHNLTTHSTGPVKNTPQPG